MSKEKYKKHNRRFFLRTMIGSVVTAAVGGGGLLREAGVIPIPTAQQTNIDETTLSSISGRLGSLLILGGGGVGIASYLADVRSNIDQG